MLQVKNVTYNVRSQMGNKTKFRVEKVNFTLEPGYLMCLLGRNGSGKSTLLQLIYGIMPVDQGSVRWFGKEIYNNSQVVRQEIAYVGEASGFFEYMTIEENIEILSLLYQEFNYEKWRDYKKKFGLDNRKETQKFIEFSTGEKRQIQLAFALARSPKLLLLDEPTANLDPVFRVEFMELLQDLMAREECSIIISTHIHEDVEEIADYIGVMSKGEMVQFGDRETILRGQDKDTLEKLLTKRSRGKDNGDEYTKVCKSD